jgi:hypothetical protein
MGLVRLMQERNVDACRQGGGMIGDRLPANRVQRYGRNTSSALAVPGCGEIGVKTQPARNQAISITMHIVDSFCNESLAL